MFGTASGFGVDVGGRQVIDLTTLTAAQGFVIQGDVAGDLAGISVSSAGDVNGDGFDDLIVGANLGDDGGADAGEAYVVFGTASGFGVDVGGRQVVDLTGLSAAQGFAIQGDAAGDFGGTSVSAAGDVNSDGFDDLIVGAHGGDDGGTSAGEAYVLFGGAFGGSTAPVTTTGTAAAEILIGGLGADTLTGGGGLDVIRGGAGDDRLAVGDLTFRAIDGGSGTDTLALTGAGQTFDLTNRALAGKVEGIERIELTGSGNNTLVVDRLAVINETGATASGTHVLTLAGNAGDTVTFTDPGWTLVGTVTEASVTYDRYVLGNAEVRVQQGVSAVASGVDLTFITAAQGFIVQGDTAADQAGWSVSDAGDVNGDGFDDVIIGARDGDDGGANAGEAYVVFGSVSGFGVTVNGRQVTDLTTLSAAEGFIIQGDTAGDRAGQSVSAAGDINGDGFDDLIIGADSGGDGGAGAGEAYVVFGMASGFGVNVGGRQVIDLTTLSVAEGFIIQGDYTRDYAGRSVSTAGDVNGDGFADLIVGALYGDDGGATAGEAYVVFGSASGFGVDVGGRQVIDLTTLTAAQGFVIQGDTADDYAGVSVSVAGDVNGDGFDDVLVGAMRGDDGGGNAGEAYVVFGTGSGFGVNVGGRQVIDLTTLSAAQGFIIQGDTASDSAGYSVSTAGDVNGDGFDDMIVGASGGDDGGAQAGEAYVVFGTAAGFGNNVGGRQVIDLTTLTAAQGFIIQGDTADDTAGTSVSSAGDVNGDGFDDLIVGATGGDDGGAQAGEAYVLFGTAAGFGINVGGRQVVDLSTLTVAQGFKIQGDVASDLAGFSVSSADDVNGDGFDDLIVGARFGDDGGANAGEAYVLFGGAFGHGTTPVTTTGTAAAEMLIGGLGADTLTGGGGLDVIRAGAGRDMISVPDLAFRSIDGGAGVDTLVFTGIAQTIDFSTFANNKVKGIEAFDITSTGNDTIVVGALDAFHFSDTPNADFTAAHAKNNSIIFIGDAGDTIDLNGYDPDGGGPLAAYAWQLVASDVGLDGTAAGGLDHYDLVRSGVVYASVAVDADMLVT